MTCAQRALNTVARSNNVRRRNGESSFSRYSSFQNLGGGGPVLRVPRFSGEATLRRRGALSFRRRASTIGGATPMIFDDQQYLVLDGMLEDAAGRNWRAVGDILRPPVKEMIVNAALAGFISPERAFFEINERGLKHV